MWDSLFSLLSIQEIQNHLTNKQIRNRLLLEITIFPAIITAIYWYNHQTSSIKTLLTFVCLAIFGLIFELIFFHFTKHITTEPYGLILSQWLLDPLADVVGLAL